MLINYKKVKERYKNSSYYHYAYVFKTYNLENELINKKYLLNIYSE